MKMAKVYILFATCSILVTLCFSEEDRLPRPTIVQYAEKVKFENLMMDSKSIYEKRNYRALIFNDDLSELYVGGREELLRVDPVSMEIINTTEVNTTPSSKNACEAAKPGSPLCSNYVRIIQPFGDNALFVCGTDAQSPKCYFANADGTSLTDADPLFAVDNGAPSDPHQNTSWLYLHEDFKLYTAVGAMNKVSQVDYDIRLSNLTSFGMMYDAGDEVRADENQEWFSEPDFVGEPFEHEGRIYFFFREFASEHVNGGRIVYARVGRICKDDTGGEEFQSLYKEFTTYQKARLDCSVRDNNLDYDYNELQDVFRSDVTIFAVFTTPRPGPSGSAVCAYSLDEIVELFNLGQVSGQSSNGFLWTPPDASTIPSDVFKCSALPFNRTYNDFLERYLLMDKEVHNKLDYKDSSTNSYMRESDAPLILVDDKRLVQIVVVEDVNGRDVFFLGTENGSVIKAHLLADNSKAVLVEEIDLNMDDKPVAPILTMLHDVSRDAIYIGTDNSLYKLPLQSGCTVQPPTSTVQPPTSTDVPISDGITVVRHQPCHICNKAPCPKTPCEITIPAYENANLNFAAHAPEGAGLTASEVICDCVGDTPKTVISNSVCSGKEFVTVNAVLNVTDLKGCSCHVTFNLVSGVNTTLDTEITIDISTKITDLICITEANDYDTRIREYKYDLKMWKNRMINGSSCATSTGTCRQECGL